MSDVTNETAKSLFLFYKKQYDALVNTYCQAKKNHPFEQYPKLGRAIWKVSRLMEVWHGVAVVNAVQKHQGE